MVLQMSCVKCVSGNGLEIVLNSKKCCKTFAKLQDKGLVLQMFCLKIIGIFAEKLYYFSSHIVRKGRFYV